MKRFPGRHTMGASLVALAIVLALPPGGPRPLLAQSPSTGALEGVVRDAQGRPLNTVAVTLIHELSGRRQIVRTNRRGEYSATSVEPGTYDVLIERLGYQPERLEGVAIRAGEARVLSIGLEAVEGAEVRVRVRPATAALSASAGAVPARWLTNTVTGGGVPQQAGDLAELVALGPSSGMRLDIEGMPATAHALAVDGVPLAKRPRAFGAWTRLASFPLSFFEAASAGGGPADVEYPGRAGGLVSAHTSRGGPVRSVRAFADFSADALTLSGDDVASFQSVRAGGLASGPLGGDTANFVLGVDYTRLRVPYLSLWAPTASSEGVRSAASSRGVDLTPYTGPGLAELERIAAFGRLDARVGDAHRLSVRAMAASLPALVPFNAWSEGPAGWRGNPESTEIFAAAQLHSLVADNVTSELSLGYERSDMSRRDPEDPAVDLPATVVAASGLTFGSSERRTVDMGVWSLTGRETVQIRVGDHRLKFGLAALLPYYDIPWFYGRSGEFTFSDQAALQAGNGGYREVRGDDRIRADFSLRRITVYAQDTWRPRPGLEIISGARVSAFRNVDSALVNLNPEWLRLAGLRNPDVKQKYAVVEPRFALRLTPGGEGGVTLNVGASVDADMPDPAHFAEVMNNAGFLEVRRFVSSPWPAGPGAAADPGIPALTMLGPEFEGPRTTRLHASLATPLGGGAILSLGASVRRTDHLPRRKDLNLIPTVPATDQFGRPVYGALRKSGTLLYADSSSSRRFTEFDQVWGIEATAESRYVGLTVGVERPLAGGFGAFLSYTWSRTEDDWLLGNPADPLSQLNPFPHGADDEWVDGRSDLDVPHRALAGLEVKVPGRLGPRLTALYRFQSGYPFTPGFRPGVDANGDGSAVNDAAYVDDRIAGMTDLLSAWPCLSSRTGGFAERNGCRAPNLQALDARLAFEIGFAGARALSVIVDAVNLIATEDGVVDRALYLVPPAANLTVSPDGRSYTVPLAANPDFGTMRNRFTPQRFLRLGMRVGF